MRRSEYDKMKLEHKTIFTAMEPPSKVGLLNVAITHHGPPKPSSLAKHLKRLEGDEAYLHLVPGSFDLVKYSLISDHDKLDAVQARFLHFVSLARSEYDFVVIDCNPGSRSSRCVLFMPVPDCWYRSTRSILILGLELLADFLDPNPTIDPNPTSQSF